MGRKWVFNGGPISRNGDYFSNVEGGKAYRKRQGAKVAPDRMFLASNDFLMDVVDAHRTPSLRRPEICYGQKGSCSHSASIAASLGSSVCAASNMSNAEALEPLHSPRKN